MNISRQSYYNILACFLLVGLFFLGRKSFDIVLPPFSFFDTSNITLSLVSSFFLLLIIGVENKRAQHEKIGVFYLSLVLIFLCYSASSFIWTAGNVYSEEKTYKILNLIVMVVFSYIVVSKLSRERIYLLFNYVSDVILLIAVAYILMHMSNGISSSDRIGFAGSGSITIGRVFSFGAIVYFHRIFTDRTLKSFVAIIALMLACYLTGSRGNFIFMLLAMSSLLFLSKALDRTLKVRILLGICVFIFALVLFCVLYFDSIDDIPFIYRYLIMFNTDNTNLSILYRFDKYSTSLDMLLANPWGFGIGSFPLFTEVIDVVDYPHNMIFEVMAELGFIGLVAVLSIITFVIVKLRIKSALIFSLWFFYLLTSQSSGDLFDARLVFILPLFFNYKSEN